MKFRRLLSLLVVATAFSVIISGCKNNTGDSSSGNTQTVVQENTVSFEKTEVELLLGEETYLLASYEPIEGLTAEYSSKDSSIATIDPNGKITAICFGETIVTVKYGEATAECKVAVVRGNSVPSLCFSYGWEDFVTIELNNTVDLSSFVLFDKKTYDNHTVTYTLDDNTIGKTENGLFVAQKVGTCTAKLNAVWYGFEGVMLEKTVTITVVPEFELYVNDGAESYVLYNKAKVGSQTFATEMDFVVSAFENGKELSYQVEVIQGTDIVKYENDKLTVLNGNVGGALLKVSCQDSAGISYELLISVNVYTPGPPDSGYFDTDWIEL